MEKHGDWAMICWGCELLRFSLCCTSFWWTWQPLHLGWLLRATFCFSPEGGNETSSWNKSAKIKQNSQQSYPMVTCNFWPTVQQYPPIHPASSDVAEEPQYGQCTVRASSEEGPTMDLGFIPNDVMNLPFLGPYADCRNTKLFMISHWGWCLRMGLPSEVFQ